MHRGPKGDNAALTPPRFTTVLPSETEFRDALAAPGLEDVEIRETHPSAPARRSCDHPRRQARGSSPGTKGRGARNDWSMTDFLVVFRSENQAGGRSRGADR